MKSQTQTKTYSNYVNNEWVSSKRTREVLNPFNGETIALVPESGKKDVDTAIAAARRAFDSGPWRDFTAQQRGRILFAMADIVRKNAAMLAEFETLNCGKPIVESEFDMNDTANCFEYYGGLATKIHGETLPVPDNALNMTLREPIGVAGLIVPWNYPLMLAAWKLGPALAAGCTVILKPAEQTPITTLEFARLVRESISDLPAGVLNVVTGDGPIAGGAIVESMEVDKVAFTGGTETGREKVEGYIEIGRKEAKLVAGGRRPSSKELKNGYFIEPTIFESDNKARIAREEIFGPVVACIPFKDETDALQIANDTPYGLAAAVWSRDIFKCLRMVKSLRAGIVWVNTMQPCYVESPWGGYKQSGHGRELSLHGVEEFLETKQVHINLSERPIGWY